MNLKLEVLLADSANTVFKSVLFVVLLLLVAGILNLILIISLLPKLAVCGGTVFRCVVVILAIVFLGLVVPFIMLWCARGYVLLKALYQLFKLHEEPIVQQCAQQICKHRQAIVSAGELRKSKLVGKVPLPVKVIIGRLDLEPLLTLLKSNPALQPQDLIQPLKDRIAAQAMVKNPSLLWWWVLVGLMFLTAGGVWWFI